MKRNSTTLFLESPGATTPLPWVDNAPDFSGFTEPSLGVLQSFWRAFLDSGEELEVVPDPPPPPPEPNWEGFNLALLQNNDFQIAAAVNPLVTNALTTALNNVMMGFISAQGFSPYVETFVSVAGVTPQQREDWAAIAIANNLPTEVAAIVAGST